MTKPIRQSLNVIFYVVVFFLLQVLTHCLATLGFYVKQGSGLAEAFGQLTQRGLSTDIDVILASTLLSSLLTIWLFLRARWTPFSRDYLRSRPWSALIWVVLAAFGSLAPSIWLNELLSLQMPESAEHILTEMMRHPMGYLFISILAPVAEEVVFRGAILYSLLTVMQGRWRWGAIVISAVIFGIIHGNDAQFLHATLIGLLLGWMYERTRSIFPGLVYHWINNSIVFVAANLYPGSTTATLSELAGGSQSRVALWVVFSLCIFVPALFQLNRRLKRG